MTARSLPFVLSVIAGATEIISVLGLDPEKMVKPYVATAA